jgi:hypothetical protein
MPCTADVGARRLHLAARGGRDPDARAARSARALARDSGARRRPHHAARHVRPPACRDDHQRAGAEARDRSTRGRRPLAGRRTAARLARPPAGLGGRAVSDRRARGGAKAPRPAGVRDHGRRNAPSQIRGPLRRGRQRSAAEAARGDRRTTAGRPGRGRAISARGRGCEDRSIVAGLRRLAAAHVSGGRRRDRPLAVRPALRAGGRGLAAAQGAARSGRKRGGHERYRRRTRRLGRVARRIDALCDGCGGPAARRGADDRRGARRPLGRAASSSAARRAPICRPHRRAR